MTLDLRENALMMENDSFMIQSLPTFSSSTASACENVSEIPSGEVFLPLYVSTSCQSTSSPPERLQLLAQRLHRLRDQQPAGDGTICPERSSQKKKSVLEQSPPKGAQQPVRFVADMHQVPPSSELQYKANKGYHGEHHHMGPTPHTIRSVMESQASAKRRLSTAG